MNEIINFGPEVAHLLEKISGASILCLGDVMLDRYIYGRAERLSPEAPVPVIHVSRRVSMPGGMGNVLSNLNALGCRSKAVCVCGDDDRADEMHRLFCAAGIAPKFIRDASRPTVTKTRIIAGIQQVVRFDEEDPRPIPSEIADQLLEAVRENLPQVGSVALSDYGKGSLTPEVLAQILDLGNKLGVPVIVDPKGNDYSIYRNAYLITPNRAELSLAVGKKLETNQDLAWYGRQLMEEHGIHNLLITLSDQGMMLLAGPDGPGGQGGHVGQNSAPLLLPALAKEVFDVSGAGDTVVAVMAAALAVGANLSLGAKLATLAAGVVVGKVGTAVATPEDIRQAMA